MPLTYRYLLASALLLAVNVMTAQRFWTGPPVTITKPSLADWTLPENQDSLTASVRLTRANGGGLFNIAQETEYDRSGAQLSPLGTEWAVGSLTDGLDSLEFDTWANVNSGSNGGFEGRDMVVHLLDEDIYFDINITDWSRGSGGGGAGGSGGFTYVRSSDPGISSNRRVTEPLGLTVYPNPASTIIQIDGAVVGQAYRIINIRGQIIVKGTVGDNTAINIRLVPTGNYLIQVASGQSASFSKRPG